MTRPVAPDEDLPDHHPAGRRLLAVAVVVAVALAVVGIVTATRRGGTDRAGSAGPTPSARPTPTPSPTLSIPPNPTSGPEQDAIPALNRCGGDCVTYALSQTMLGRTGLRGLTPTFGLRVTDGRREQLRSIIGRAGGGQVHLLYERVSLPDAAVRVTDSKGPNRTVVLAVIRDGWRLTAVLIGATPPTAAAMAWARSAPLPG